VAPEVVKAFAADRAPFVGSMRRQTVADAAANLAGTLAALDSQVADGRPFLFGADASIADFAVAHCLWYVRRAPPVAGIVTQHAALTRWHDRIVAAGHGRSEPMTSAAALERARTAAHHAPTTVQAGLGFEAGQAVTVTPTDYGLDPSAGTLVGLSADEVVIRRHDERAGTVHVHFPRAGFQVKQEQA